MTPIYKILIPKSNNLNIENIWAKMENQINMEYQEGTHKARSLRPWIEQHIQERGKHWKPRFVISSSGNSAFSAAKYCREIGAKLYVYMHPDYIDKSHDLLNKYRDTMVFCEVNAPKRAAFRFAKENNIPYLRASTDDYALIGYKEIAKELLDSIENEELPLIDNIFIPTSSGATLVGIYQGFMESNSAATPALYVVQTTKVHAIADCLDGSFKKENEESESHAKAIVDKIAHRRKEVVKIAQETGGGGFVISNNELQDAHYLLALDGVLDKEYFDPRNIKMGILRSGNWQSVLAFAGFLKWREKYPDKAKNQISVCLFTD